MFVCVCLYLYTYGLVVQRNQNVDKLLTFSTSRGKYSFNFYGSHVDLSTYFVEISHFELHKYIAQGHWAALNQAFFKSKQNNLL